MSIIERKGRFYVTVGTGDERYRASSDSLKKAELLNDQELTKRGMSPARKTSSQRYEKSLVAHTEAAAGMNLDKLLNIAIKTKWADAKSLKNMIGTTRGMFEVINPRMHPKDVTAKVLREATVKLAEMGNTGATINRKLSAISVLLKIAQEDDLIVNRPTLPRRKESDHRIRFLSKAEEDRCLAWCDNWGANDLADFISCAIDSGFRRAELLGVRNDQFYNGMLHLDHGETKNNKARAIPCSDRVLAILERRRASGGTTVFHGYSDSQLRRHWELMVDSLGFSNEPQFVVHMLRHTCASRLAITGHNSAFIKMWMGHATILTTERYMHLSQDTLKSGASSLSKFRE